MNKSYQEIEQYIAEIKALIKENKYRIETNRNRQANLDLYKEFVIDETKSKEILLGLRADDFCEAMQNEHRGFAHELLYVFGKEVRLLQRFGTEELVVPLYIKFNKLETPFVVVISFHKQAYPLHYAFR